ncbi:hypothetical protein Q4489_17330 [Thalassotalea sp. 1_MG-2023]|uniref:hypothetical protein n=1 Tax=Thalassotalea sp. 1_MG-2023 TaxID=3062680 RepID=UPI0026E20786|nr:hypothetical protein [Thalassotalea sp. 1_MG-2023]MDO6428774.1 hypothetical protein [Thalassotalea sp. 1_MG-2023]
MKTEFDNLRLNSQHQYDTDSNGDKQVVKIYCDDVLIAKQVKVKKSIRYFAVKNYRDFLTH